jgi:hypothetical protein
MKQCAYCGRQNADEAPRCAECGSDEFTNLSAPAQKVNPKTMVVLVGIALLVGASVAVVSFVTAWLETRGAPGFTVQQIITRFDLARIQSALEAYQQASNAPAPSLATLKGFTNLSNRTSGELLDGWERPYHYESNEAGAIVFSYGRDGEPMGVGLDYDLTTRDPRAKESLPTFRQFLYDLRTGKMQGVSILSGLVAFFLTLFSARKLTFSIRSILLFAFKIGIVIIGATSVAVILSALHVPTGH